MTLGFDIALLAAVGVNVGINIVNSSKGTWASFRRWFRLRNSQLISISRVHNPNVFYEITKMLNSICSKMKHRTLITFGSSDISHVYYVPDRNSEIELPTKYGSIYIKVVSADGYHIDAYELTCKVDYKYALDKFMIGIYSIMKPNMPAEELSTHIKDAEISVENDAKYELKPNRKTCSSPFCDCDIGWKECPKYIIQYDYYQFVY